MQVFYTRMEDDNVLCAKHFDVLLIVQSICLWMELRWGKLHTFITKVICIF